MVNLHRRSGAATLATGDGVRVGPQLLETGGSGKALLGRYDSGMYRNSTLNHCDAVPGRHDLHSRR